MQEVLGQGHPAGRQVQDLIAGREVQEGQESDGQDGSSNRVVAGE